MISYLTQDTLKLVMSSTSMTSKSDSKLWPNSLKSSIPQIIERLLAEKITECNISAIIITWNVTWLIPANQKPRIQANILRYWLPKCDIGNMDVTKNLKCRFCGLHLYKCNLSYTKRTTKLREILCKNRQIVPLSVCDAAGKNIFAASKILNP